MYWRPPDAKQLAAFGLTAADYPRPEIVLWQDNVVAFGVFCRMATQWRMGAAGPIGLDYNVLPFVLDLVGVARDRWEQVVEDVRVMEHAALTVINEG